MKYNGVIGRNNHPKIWYGKMKASLGVVIPEEPVEPEIPSELDPDLTSYFTFADVDDTNVEITGLTDEGVTWVASSTDYKSAGEVILPRYAKPDGVVKTVKGIGASAFASNEGIKTATFEEGIEYVGDNAFNTCTSLVTVTFKEGLLSTGYRAFYKCTALSKADLPEGFTTLGASTFYGCSVLAMAYLPTTLTSMGTFAFCGCNYVGINTVPRGITTIPAYAFYNCNSMYMFKIPDTVSRIDQNAFEKCSNLDAVVFHNKPLSLGDNVFTADTLTDSYLGVCYYVGTKDEKTANLTYDTNASTSGLPNQSWTYWGSPIAIDGIYYTLQDDNKARVEGFVDNTIVDLTIPATISYDGVDYAVNYINDCAFIGNIELRSLRVLGTVTTVGDFAFWRCKALESVVFDNYIELTGYLTASRCVGNNFGFCTAMTEFYANCFATPNEAIPYRAFRDCDSLVEFIVPDLLNTIAQEAFAGCNKLEKLVLPASLKNFYTCAVVGTNLKTVDYKGTNKDDIYLNSAYTNGSAGLTKLNAATWNIGVA